MIPFSCAVDLGDTNAEDDEVVVVPDARRDESDAREVGEPTGTLVEGARKDPKLGDGRGNEGERRAVADGVVRGLPVEAAEELVYGRA